MQVNASYFTLQLLKNCNHILFSNIWSEAPDIWIRYDAQHYSQWLILANWINAHILANLKYSGIRYLNWKDRCLIIYRKFLFQVMNQRVALSSFFSQEQRCINYAPVPKSNAKSWTSMRADVSKNIYASIKIYGLSIIGFFSTFCVLKMGDSE